MKSELLLGIAGVLLLCAAGMAQTRPSAGPDGKLDQAGIMELHKAAMEQIKALQPRIDALRKSKDARIIEGLEAIDIRIAAIDWTARVQAVQRRTDFDMFSGVARLRACPKEVEMLLGELDEGKGPYDRFRGTWTATYRSKVDDNVMPYTVSVPLDYDASKKYPLLINLHCAGCNGARAAKYAFMREAAVTKAPSPPNFAKGIVTGAAVAVPPDRIVVAPTGRGNCWYQWLGQVDVLEVIEDACRRYNIDRERIYCTGMSLGGGGTMGLCMMYPDLLAAAIPDQGSYNHTRNAAPWELPSRRMISPDQFFENAFNFPLFVSESTSTKGVYHLSVDVNGVMADKKIRELMAKGEQFPVYKYGEPIYSEEKFDWTKPWDNRAWRWMSQYKLNTAPPKVLLKTYSLRFSKVHWLTIDGCEDALAFMRADAEVKDGVLGIKTTNISSLTIKLPAALVGDKPPAVKIDGAAVDASLKADTAVSFYKSASGWGTKPPADAGKALVKKHGLSGPIPDVFYGQPVLLVYGTQGVDAAKSQDAAWADVHQALFSGSGLPGEVWSDGLPSRADKGVTPDDIRDRNLILIGRPAENALLAKVLPQLPIKVAEQEIAVGKVSAKGQNLGCLMAYPNPLNPQRYVLVWLGKVGQFTGWYLPDFLIFPEGKRPVAGGYFDRNWQP
ncbi:MAG: hypothetical protein ACE15C_07220 [Phycisphaerae bacterium]